MKLRKR